MMEVNDVNHACNTDNPHYNCIGNPKDILRTHSFTDAAVEKCNEDEGAKDDVPCLVKGISIIQHSLTDTLL